MACGPLARDVPRRNLRRASLVSWEKEYSLDSEACGGWSVPGGGIWLADGEVSSRTELRGGGWNGGESHHGERAGGGLVEEGVGLRPFNVFELRETDVPAVSRQDGQTRMRLFTEFCSGKECRGPQVSGMMPRIDGPLPSDSIAAPVSCPATRRHRTALHLALDIGSRPRPCSLSERKVTSPNGIDRLNSPGAASPLFAHLKEKRDKFCQFAPESSPGNYCTPPSLTVRVGYLVSPDTKHVLTALPALPPLVPSAAESCTLFRRASAPTVIRSSDHDVSWGPQLADDSHGGVSGYWG